MAAHRIDFEIRAIFAFGLACAAAIAARRPAPPAPITARDRLEKFARHSSSFVYFAAGLAKNVSLLLYR
jgi:hypothetical protein